VGVASCLSAVSLGRAGLERRRNNILGSHTADIDQDFTHHDAGNADTLFDRVDRTAVKVEATPAAKVSAKLETARVAEQGSRLFGSRPNHRHVIGLRDVAATRQKLWLSQGAPPDVAIPLRPFSDRCQQFLFSLGGRSHSVIAASIMAR